MSLPAGKQLGPYKVLSPIGKGGMGEVYRARDERLGRNVAIKVLPEHLSKKTDALKRFEREAKALAVLSHPNILTIYDIGKQEDVFFVVMELLEGETLRACIQRSALTWKKAIDIAIQTTEGLTAAHSKGIVHRDLKPENIFQTTEGRVKILDFGLAQLKPLVSEEQPIEVVTESLQTETGVIMGTVPYMSPEQLRGASVDSRTDIFSFGSVLYEMVTGRRPFSGNTTAEICASILKDDPVGPVESGKEVSLEMDHLIMRCLEKNPERRFQSAADLAFALKEIVGPSGISQKTVRKPGLQTYLFSRAAMLTVSVLLVAALFYLFVKNGKTIDSLAVLPFVNAGGDPETEYLSDGITESLINNLSRLPKLKIMARSTVFTYKGRQVDPRKVGSELNVRAVLTGKLVQRGQNLIIQADLVDASDGSQIWGEQYDRKFSDILNIQQDIAKQIFEGLQIKLTDEEQKRVTKSYTQNTEAYQLYLRGRFYWNKRTPEGLQKALDYFRKAIDEDPLYAPAYAGTADTYLTLFDYELLPAQEANSKARAAVRKALEIDDKLAEAHSSLAHLYLHDWKWSEAESEFKRAIALDPGYSTAYHWHSLSLTAMGRLDEAVQSMKKAQELDPLSLRINADLGMALFAARQYKEAIEQERKTLELNPNFSTALWIQGMAYEQQESLPEAIQKFQEALKRSPGNPNYLAALGHAYGIAGKKAEALKVLEQMKVQSKQEPVSPFFYALVYTGLGEKDSALQWLEKAYRERSGSIRYLKVEPRLDSIRADPRFTDLMRRVGLE